ncbi:MAG: hypothetical protein TIS_00351 [Tissierella sp.]
MKKLELVIFMLIAVRGKLRTYMYEERYLVLRILEI